MYLLMSCDFSLLFFILCLLLIGFLGNYRFPAISLIVARVEGAYLRLARILSVGKVLFVTHLREK